MKTEFKKIVFSLAVFFCASCIASADWNPGEPYKMHFPQLPNPYGWDICLLEQSVADDFQCTATGPITDIHFWVSWQSDVVDWQSTTFTVQIWSNIPGGPCNGGMPGMPLWTWNGQGNFVIRQPPERGDQGWHCPATGLTIRPDHQYYWQINITGIPQPFIQQVGTTYWLVIKANKMDWPPAVGWKTSLDRFQSCALWSTGMSAWMPVMADGETVDQAFVIANHDPGVAPDFGDAPDPTYPTLLASNGARHNIVAGMFLGAAIDGEPDGQPTVNADGDDLAGIPDDEDGVTFSTPLIPGQAATINVVASVAGMLDAWVDFNADGSWMQAGDQIAISAPLVPGNNAITFIVPATASSGMTYARFRFSGIGGLPPFGPAPDGEVEDYTVIIEQELPDPNVKYIQHPDLTPTGIDIRVDDGDGVTRHIADDFPCTTTGPITDVHFWGSWKNDEKGQINGFVIRFYSDDPVGPGGPDPDNVFSKPDQLLWSRIFEPGEFIETMYKDLSPEFEWWWDPFFHVQDPNGDHLVWKYDINIDPVVAFRQQGTPTNPKVYWLEIEAWTPYQTLGNNFGWKTAREHWNDDAVFANGSNYPWVSGWSELRYPQGHPYYPESLDMAFAITTGAEPNIPEDPNLKYLQPPDLTNNGIDVRFDQSDGITRTLADDFPCTSRGRITDVHLWGSWLNDFKGNVEKIHLSIHSDIPAWQSPTGYSMPGTLLWQNDFTPTNFTETLEYTLPPGLYEWWMDPYMPIQPNPMGDTMVWRYDITIPPDKVFEQTGEPNNPKVYWLDAYAIVHDPAGGNAAQMGWKTSQVHWNDAAVYDMGGWQKLMYPYMHPYGEQTNIDLAFAITTKKDCLKPTDPGYNTWVALGKPKCWCYRRQCRGDGNGTSTLGKPVTAADFTNFQAGYNKTITQLKGVVDIYGVSAICADYNHLIMLSKPVTAADFTIFQTYYNKPTTSVPQCPSTHINFWTN